MIFEINNGCKKFKYIASVQDTKSVLVHNWNSVVHF